MSEIKELMDLADRAESGIVKVDGTLQSANNCLAQINDIGNKVVAISQSWADMQLEMHKLDLQFDAYIAGLNNNLERYRISAPIVNEQLNNVDRVMNRILDKVLEMDVKTSLDMENKTRMMDSLDSYIDKIATMMIKLL